jgi:two-component system CheB/CheR fusion protein
VVPHLPPRHESLMSEILARISALPVRDAQSGMQVERNRVYVLPAGSDIDLRDSTFVLTARKAKSGQHRPIDHFFHSLAEHHGHKAIGVILSGSGSDGAVGIQEIKAAGGITFAQDDTAQQSSMPRSAIQTGAVDFVLRPEDIARELARIANHPVVAAPQAQQDAIPDLDLVLQALREATGVDFTQYKRNTLYRRIARRIVLHKLDSLDEYVHMLSADAAEADALYQDILINVTSFFRNPDAFDALKADVFPALTHNRSRHDPVRIWTLGCSTGEEAYSLAVAFAEFAEGLGRTVPVQVFATDLNPVSIEKARAGIYPASATADVSPDRLRRFFVELDGHNRIAKSIRDACIFARHNVLEDPPFSRIDLVSCRNMLIYLGAELQQKVIPVLHYALRPGGFLWLGTSETIGSYRDLFELKNTRYKIYAKKAVASQAPTIIAAQAQRSTPAPGTPAHFPPADLKAPDPQREMDRLLVGRYAPPGVLVRSDLDIVQYRGNTAPFLTPAPGRATLNLLKMLREGLVLGVRSAIQRARTEETAVRQEGLVMQSNGSERRVNIEVIPVKSGVQRAEHFMVLFDEEQPKLDAMPRTGAAATEDAEPQELGRLKQELAATREYLQSVIEQQEAANEELQSANEEVQSANEELQSINEELETSKEEVQSSNEELATVNDELHARNAELAQTNNDLINLLSSVQMAIVMLGPNLRIRRFTPMAERLLNLIPTDVGRPVSDIKLNIEVPDLEHLVTETMETVSVHEREVQDRQGRWHLLRVRPYRTLENKIDGAVIVLVDVDSLKRNQEMLRQQTELLNQAHEPIVMWELDGAVNYWNEAAEETYGFTHEQAQGRKVDELLLAVPPHESYKEELRRNGHWTGELVHTRRDGQKIIVETRMAVVTDTEGRKLVVQADRPITERKESERILRSLADNLVAADRNKDEFLAMLAHELRNPLAPLRNAVAVIKSSGAEAAQKSRALDIMARQVGNMGRLIDDLLDVSRITLSQIELRKSPIDLVETAQRVAEQHSAVVEARKQRLHLSLPREPVVVEGDEVRIEQIVGNLLDNASKYTPEAGDIWLSVERSAGTYGGSFSNAGGDEAVIRVRDNGIGIAADKLPHVFDLFMRATRSIDHRYGGLGVGLTLVRRLTEMHGGRVEAHSAGAGKGSEFVVRLPLDTPAQRGKAQAPAAGGRAAEPCRVLVVDDNLDNLESTAMSLRLFEHEVETADSGRRALAIAAEFKPEVVVIDLGMPDMDGLELARQIRERSEDGVRLVALSGYGHDEARRRARSAGFARYLVKPAGPEDLNEAIGEVRAAARKPE